ncbi:sialate O-acetylesterase [Jannaschia pohangensis]|uniref:Sialate O-acetylesterase domain-containing protein n=1 Tax=Jannaschia pohangensis TaxID=390807 RepID=A0A1I3QTQ3_9RHOB|nr:sialate O-acetylesterase [Jannaschia pohangensis]SFJ36889.1 hypothetical protein SAMN04488095_2649 [Jannaschia pohangensis]
MPIIIRPSGDTDLSNATLHEDTALPQTITGLAAGSWQVGRLSWAPDPAEVTDAVASEDPLLLMVAGQSNSRTAGNSGAIPAAKYTTGPVFADVFIFVRGPGANISAQIAAGDFQPYDITANADPDNSGTAWGSEAEFIWQMRQAGDMRPVYVVKESQNGQNLAIQWAPGTSGDNFAFLEAKVARARTLAGTFGDEVMLWNQGEADANRIDFSTAYAANWTAFLTAFRARVSATAFFVAERIRPLGYEGASITDNSQGFINASAVREATIAGVVADGNGTVVDTDFDLSNFDSIHPGEPWTEGKGLRAHAAWTGTYDATFGPITRTTPVPFAIPNATDVTPGDVIAAAPVTIAGLERRAPVSISGGQWRALNALDADFVVQDWTSSAGHIDKFHRLQIRTTASATEGQTNIVSLDVGGLAVDWSVTTFASVPSYGPETQAFINTAAANGGISLSGQQAAALDAFFATATATTWWPKMLRLYGRLGDAVSSSLDLIDQATSLTSVAPNDPPYQWTAAAGWSPQASSNTGLDLKVDPSTQLPQDDCAVGVFYSALSQDTRGDLNGGNGIYLRATTGGAARYLLNSAANTNASGLSTAPGLRAIVRSGPTALSLHGPDGSVIASSATASVAPTGTALALGNPGIGNLTSGIHSATASFLGAFAAGAALSPAEMQDLATTMQTLHAAFAV